MKSIVIGTAGHIDHGKTALVKALTGIDADRLEEEKRRGITIDLGFAHMELPLPGGEKLRIGFVDVPGHERFVRNMLAGVGGIDLVLLVIAADEAIMPQTREHFEILQLLGVRHGITVLTKSDAVDAETLEVVRLEVEEFLRGTFLESPAPIMAVSSLTGAGLQDLKNAICVVASKLPPRVARAIARLPIDRVFTMKGFGTVVTGTLIAGTIRREEEMEVLPSGRRVRVRGVQVHGETTGAAAAGQRTALNLSGASTEDLMRGMMLTRPGLLKTSRSLDVRLRLLPSAPRALKNRARVHFHAHSMESIGEVVLYAAAGSEAAGKIELLPGRESFAQIKLPEAAMLLPGDRFIIRQFSPVVTIGGGVVLDAMPLARGPERVNFLQTLGEESSEAALLARIARRKSEGISMAHLVAETGFTEEMVETHLADALKHGAVIHAGSLLLNSDSARELRSQIVSAVGSFHTDNPLVGGINKEELRTQVEAGAEVFGAIIDSMALEKQIEITGELVRLPGHGVVMNDEEAESRKMIEEAFCRAGLQVPALKEVLDGLKVDRVRAQKIVTLLLREKVLIKISDDLIFHQSALSALRKKIAGYKAKSSKIDVSGFKELTGITRKYAIPLLEYFDRERVTRRVGGAREIL